MMKRALVSALALLSLCACSDGSSIAAAYKSPWDRLVVRLGFGFGYEPCYRKEKSAYGDTYRFTGDEACFRFDPPVKMRGIWIDEFEGSRFLPDATEAPAESRYSRDGIWLDFDQAEPLLAGGKNGERRAFAIEFVGIRASFPGEYGHMGMSRRLVIVKDLLSARPVTPPKDP